MGCRATTVSRWMIQRPEPVRLGSSIRRPPGLHAPPPGRLSHPPPSRRSPIAGPPVPGLTACPGLKGATVTRHVDGLTGPKGSSAWVVRACDRPCGQRLGGEGAGSITVLWPVAFVKRRSEDLVAPRRQDAVTASVLWPRSRSWRRRRGREGGGGGRVGGRAHLEALSGLEGLLVPVHSQHRDDAQNGCAAQRD